MAEALAEPVAHRFVARFSQQHARLCFKTRSHARQSVGVATFTAENPRSWRAWLRSWGSFKTKPSPPNFELCAIEPNLPSQLSRAGAERHGFNSQIVEHVDEQVAQWNVVPFVVGHVSAVTVAAASKDDG